MSIATSSGSACAIGVVDDSEAGAAATSDAGARTDGGAATTPPPQAATSMKPISRIRHIRIEGLLTLRLATEPVVSRSRGGFDDDADHGANAVPEPWPRPRRNPCRFR